MKGILNMDGFQGDHMKKPESSDNPLLKKKPSKFDLVRKKSQHLMDAVTDTIAGKIGTAQEKTAKGENLPEEIIEENKGKISGIKDLQDQTIIKNKTREKIKAILTSIDSSVLPHSYTKVVEEYEKAIKSYKIAKEDFSAIKLLESIPGSQDSLKQEKARQGNVLLDKEKELATSTRKTLGELQLVLDFYISDKQIEEKRALMLKLREECDNKDINLVADDRLSLDSSEQHSPQEIQKANLSEGHNINHTQHNALFQETMSLLYDYRKTRENRERSKIYIDNTQLLQRMDEYIQLIKETIKKHDDQKHSNEGAGKRTGSPITYTRTSFDAYQTLPEHQHPKTDAWR